MPDLTGQSIGRYHIIEQLGEGGMATVDAQQLDRPGKRQIPPTLNPTFDWI